MVQLYAPITYEVVTGGAERDPIWMDYQLKLEIKVLGSDFMFMCQK